VKGENMATSTEAKLYGRRYPWRRWFHSDGFVLTRYIDYNGMSHTMAQQCRNASAKWGVKVSINIANDGNSISVRVLSPLGGGKPAANGGEKAGRRGKKRGAPEGRG
jgi:hypothetical protein